jgi:hypothetical protein
MNPQIVMPATEGAHNAELGRSISRLGQARTYEDLSTVIICPTRGTIHAKVVQSWMGLMRPMNQKVIGPLFGIGMEVGHSYNSMIEGVLGSPELSKWKYVLTIEEDNGPPPDGLLKLYENIEQFEGLSGMYWTKGQEGQPMIYGNPSVLPKNFIPQMPIPNCIMRCNGIGMGFALFKMELFKKITPPWFETMQKFEEGKGTKCYTQDLAFCEKASAAAGARFGVDTRVRVGHYDADNDIWW